MISSINDLIVQVPGAGFVLSLADTDVGVNETAGLNEVVSLDEAVGFDEAAMALSFFWARHLECQMSV